MSIFHILLVFNLHDKTPFELFPQNFNTKCPTSGAIRRCKNIAEQFNPLSSVHQRHRRQTTDGWLMP